MKTYIIGCTLWESKTPFRVTAKDEDEALRKVFEHMGMNSYKVIGIED